MSAEALTWARSLRGLSCPQRCLIYVLAIRADDLGESWPSIPTLCAETGLCQAALSRAIKKLCAYGLIEKRYGEHRSVTYRLNLTSDTTLVRGTTLVPDTTLVPSTIVPGTTLVPDTNNLVPDTTHPSTTYYLKNNEKTVKNTLSAGSTSGAEVSPSTESEQEAQAEEKDASSELSEQKQKKPREQKPFEPPTLAQVQGYIKNMGYIVDGLEFWQYYERNGWQRVVKKVPQPMKDWKGELRTWNKKRLANLEQSNDTAFEQFWAAYPNKINKGDAHKAFEEVRKLLPDNLVERVRLKASTDNWVKDDGKFVPQPAKWLRNHGWEDGDCQGVSREAAILIDEEKSKWQQPMGQPKKQPMIQQSLPFDM